MSIQSLLVLLLFATLGIAADSVPVAQRYPSDAYVWQRIWTAELGQSLVVASPRLAALHVLAMQLAPRQAPVTVSVDHHLLQQSGRRIIPVVRIERQLADFDDARHLIEETRGLVDAWIAAGIAIDGIEIDHDCGSLRLAAYSTWLKQLRSAMPPGLPITITVLPDWLDSTNFESVSATVDTLVLQVHSVGRPGEGLFVAADARRWVETLSRITQKPFQVALPAYGVRLGRAADSSLRAVRAESDTLDGPGVDVHELSAAPEDVADFLRGLERDRPPQLSGLVWFRLPTFADRRAWSLRTWLAVVDGEKLESRLSAFGRPVRAAWALTTGTVDVIVSNTGSEDVAAPAAVVLPAGCLAADGVNGYAIERQGESVRLRIHRAFRIPAQGQARIGWAVCGAIPGKFNVQT